MANIQPITKTEHADKKWKRFQSYTFAGKDAVGPLTIQELPKASKVLPICFIKVGEGYTPAALQSLVPGMNLFVAPNGKWMAPYTPATYRGYPFVLGKTEAGEQLLCADMDSGLIGDEGEAIFADGEPTQTVKEVFGFLQAVQQNREATARVCTILAQHNLIQPWPLKVKTDEREKPVEGIYKIDEQALNQLSPEALAEVRDAGGLPVIYCQLLSMQNIAVLQSLAKVHADAQAAAASALPQTDGGELDLEFLNRNDTIKF